MTEIQPAHFTQGACHTAQGDRQVLASLVCGEGVALSSGGGLAVTPAAAALTSTVASGSAFIDGTQNVWQGTYHVTNDDGVDVVHAAADPTDDRIDLVVARVYDAQYAGALNEWQIEIVQGFPSPAPVAPALPANSYALSEVLITAGLVGAIPAGNYTDTREGYTLCNDSGIREVIKFTASDTFEKADYPWLRYARVRLVAGGGAGGGSGNTAVGEHSKGAGGAGGGYAESFLPASALAASETVTVGAGGTAALGLAGNVGGSSSFGALVAASGGAGGAAAAATTAATGVVGGAGGVGTAGDIRLSGSPGGSGFGSGSLGMSGVGGGSVMGGGGTARASNVSNSLAGVVGGNYGGGGSGALTTTDNVHNSGGAGAPGVVIVELYA